MDKKEQNVYDNLLLSTVFELDKFPQKSGQEGTAYFIGDNFVIKEIRGMQDSMFSYENFEKYCKELQECHKQGLAVPEIYSWTMLPSNMFKNATLDRYYVLQERIKGTDVFAHGISSSYDLHQDYCSRKEFNDAVLTKRGNLFKKIVYTYLNNYFELAEKLDAMPENLVENFVVSDYRMMKDLRYGAVDVHSANVLFNGDRLIIIDNGFMENFFATYNDEKLRQITMKDVLRILSGSLNSMACSAYYQSKWPDLAVLHSKHKKACASTMKKFINVTNKTLHPVFNDDMEYYNSKDFIHQVMEGKEVEETINMLQRNF